jgi:hypothetical protein
MARVSVHALFVSDNHDKFAIAVTRARVDSRDFLSLVCGPPGVRSPHHLWFEGWPPHVDKPAAEAPKPNAIWRLRHRELLWNNSIVRSKYKISMSF